MTGVLSLFLTGPSQRPLATLLTQALNDRLPAARMEVLEAAHGLRRLAAPAARGEALLSFESGFTREFLRQAQAHPDAPLFVLNARRDKDGAMMELLRRNNSVWPRLHLFTRDDVDAAAFLDVGLESQNIFVTGDMWVDASLPPFAPPFRAEREPLCITLWHSERADEDVLLPAFIELRAAWPELILQVSPYDARRLPELTRTWRAQGLESRLADEEGAAQADVVLFAPDRPPSDLFARSLLVMVGGGFDAGGAHNVFLPALHSLPALVGPNHERWRAWVQLLESRSALSIIHGAADISRLALLVRDERERLRGAMVLAASLVKQQRGATVRNAELVAAILAERIQDALDNPHA